MRTFTKWRPPRRTSDNWGRSKRPTVRTAGRSLSDGCRASAKRRNDVRSAAFVPTQTEPVALRVPAEFDPAFRTGKRSILRRVRGELMCKRSGAPDATDGRRTVFSCSMRPTLTFRRRQTLSRLAPGAARDRTHGVCERVSSPNCRDARLFGRPLPSRDSAFAAYNLR
jgi:hypothetical protein